MHDLRYVVEHLEEVKLGLLRRGNQYSSALDGIAALRTERNCKITVRDSKIHAQKQASELMAKMPKGTEEFAAKREELKSSNLP